MPKRIINKDLLKEKKSKICRQVIKYLSMPKRKKIIVNLAKINSIAKDGETVIVPGKVLGNGKINKNITIFAESFSTSAKKKIEKYGKTLLLKDWDRKSGRLIC
ncbi:MAG: 50S ribosomal protein L18e [Candidatus Aenigmatarchaeota archaeon]|nr:50S ribosomal protein L18e [Candidatus Aenigmarchaeota archaeon]RLJ04907.1 MAG: 50S ribosomal protein L18e [Candidatus Aenigmarchaeota archaeon]